MNTAVALYDESLDCLPEKGARPGDDARAFTLNARAAALGHYDAILAAGWFYLNGRGVAPDLKLAEYWYRKAARRGEPRAMFSLGYIAYEARAFAIARRWFERASSAGHVRSFYWLGKLAWRGHGRCRDRAAAFALFHRAARARDPEAIRVLRFLSRRRVSNRTVIHRPNYHENSLCDASPAPDAALYRSRRSRSRRRLFQADSRPLAGQQEV